MAAKDYKICLALFHAFLTKVSKRNPNLMLNDRRIITDAEIFGLIEWKLRQFCVENKTDNMNISVNSKNIIEIKAVGDLLKEINEEIEEE